MAPLKTVLLVVAAVLVATLALPVVAVIALFQHGDLGFGPPTVETAGTGSIAGQAYERAAAAARDFDPACEVPAWLLAGIGEIESGHGTHDGATITGNGDVRPPIIGIPLPSLGPDTDSGTWDGSASVDHAVGPMQFIPATWTAYGQDGNDDGVADPHNIFDAALAAAAYLCASAPPMATEPRWRTGLLAYNHSEAYVDDVLSAGRSYQPAAPPPTGAVLVRCSTQNQSAIEEHHRGGGSSQPPGPAVSSRLGGRPGPATGRRSRSASGSR